MAVNIRVPRRPTRGNRAERTLPGVRVPATPARPSVPIGSLHTFRGGAGATTTTTTTSADGFAPFDPGANYGTGRYVEFNNSIYRSIAPNGPGAFNAANWVEISPAGGLASFSTLVSYNAPDVFIGPDNNIYKATGPVPAGAFNAANFTEVSPSAGGLAAFDPAKNYIADDIFYGPDNNIYLATGPVAAASFNASSFTELSPSPAAPPGIFTPSSGNFPAATVAGQTFIAADTGRIDNVFFRPNDIITALVATPSTTTLTANWSLIPHQPIADARDGIVSDAAKHLGMVLANHATLPAGFYYSDGTSWVLVGP
ncbi:MAG: hypothetical protein ACR2QC_01545 [Gammaproteobacteria bacterium]